MPGKANRSGRAKKTLYNSIVRDGEEISVGDSAVFSSSGEPHLPYVGKIRSFWETCSGSMMVRVSYSVQAHLELNRLIGLMLGDQFNRPFLLISVLAELSISDLADQAGPPPFPCYRALFHDIKYSSVKKEWIISANLSSLSLSIFILLSLFGQRP